jgi:hypothetical protein
MMRFKYLVGISCCMFLFGCDEAALMKRWIPPESESTARHYIELLRDGQYDQIEGDLDPSIVDSNTRDTLTQMFAAFPVEIPESVKVVGVHTSRNPEYSTTDITLEYEFDRKWLLVNVTTRRKGDVSTIVGFHVDPIPDSVENLNRFTLIGRGAAQYLILACAVGSIVFSVYVFVLCTRTRIERWKWLWQLAILVGVGKLAVNWTSGQWGFFLLSVQIPSSMATAPFYGPWTIATSLPLGAILFLNHRWKMKVEGELIPPPLPTPKQGEINPLSAPSEKEGLS